MPPGKDPVDEIVEAALAPGRPLTLMQLQEAVARRALRSSRALRHRGALDGSSARFTRTPGDTWRSRPGSEYAATMGFELKCDGCAVSSDAWMRSLLAER